MEKMIIKAELPSHIDERPSMVDRRTHISNWKVDLMINKRHK